MNQKKHRINVSFSNDEYEILNFWSKKRGQSLASFVRYLAKDGIDEYEEERLSRLLKERENEKTVTSKEMWDSLCTM